MFKSILMMFFMLYVATGQAKVNQEPVPGGIAVVPINIAAQQGEIPKVYFKDNRVTVIPDDKHWGLWLAIVGIPLGQEVGTAYLDVEASGRQYTQSFQVHPKTYPSEKITVQQKYVTPPKTVLNRIQDEAQRLNRILNHWQPNFSSDLSLIKPVEGRLSSEFGVHRILNGQPRSFHKGIDYAASIGTPISAAQKGVVAEVGDYYYTGKTIVVDHGQTFKTIYCHLNKVSVAKGQSIEQGDRIGTVGKSGRASGPHLHFGVSLNNARVSPELFFDAM